VEGDLDENGMVIDFYDLKRIVNPIIEELDHSFMVSSLDKDLNTLLNNFPTKRVDVEFHSSVENIAKYLLDRIASNILPSNIKAVKVTVYETQDAYASDTRVIRE
jgi:6-pyruvoyltetrahydropterin/6-carboxytetrahydropterin synthase